MNQDNLIIKEENFSWDATAYDGIKITIALESSTMKDFTISGGFDENVSGSIMNSEGAMILDLKGINRISCTNGEVEYDGNYYSYTIIKGYSGLEVANTFQERFQIFFFISQNIKITWTLRNDGTLSSLSLKEYSRFRI